MDMPGEYSSARYNGRMPAGERGDDEANCNSTCRNSGSLDGCLQPATFEHRLPVHCSCGAGPAGRARERRSQLFRRSHGQHVRGHGRPRADAARRQNQERKGMHTRVRKMGAKYVLYDAASKTTYQLDDQTKPAQFAGEKVTVNGSLDSATNTIHVENIAAATS